MRVGILDSTREDTHGRRRTIEALSRIGAEAIVLHPLDVCFEFSSTRDVPWVRRRPLPEE